MTRMRAVIITRFGGPEVLEVRDVEAPTPGAGEARVRVRATAVNRADLLQRLGRYPAPPGAPPDIPGLELAGEVESLGPGLHDVAVGDRVFGITSGGGYAELAVVPSRTLARIPSRMTFVEAAAVPEAFITAYDALVLQGKLASGEDVLISAVASGVGTAGLQLVRALGARAIGTARTAAKLERAQRELELDEAVVAADGKFAAQVLERTRGRGVDLVLELVGGGYVGEDLACLAHKGRVVVVGLMAGASTELPLSALLYKRASVIGTVLRARPIEEKIAVTRAFEKHVVPLFERDVVRPVVGGVLSLDEAKLAHETAESNETFGKLVLTV